MVNSIRLRTHVLAKPRRRSGLDNLRSAKTPCLVCGWPCRTDANGHFCSTVCTNLYATKKVNNGL